MFEMGYDIILNILYCTYYCYSKQHLMHVMTYYKHCQKHNFTDFQHKM